MSCRRTCRNCQSWSKRRTRWPFSESCRPCAIFKAAILRQPMLATRALSWWRTTLRRAGERPLLHSSRPPPPLPRSRLRRRHLRRRRELRPCVSQQVVSNDFSFSHSFFFSLFDVTLTEHCGPGGFASFVSKDKIHKETQHCEVQIYSWLDALATGMGGSALHARCGQKCAMTMRRRQNRTGRLVTPLHFPFLFLVGKSERHSF